MFLYLVCVLFLCNLVCHLSLLFVFWLSLAFFSTYLRFFLELGNFLALFPISPVNEAEFPLSQYFHNIWIQYLLQLGARSPLNYCLPNVTFLPLSAKVLIHHHLRLLPNIKPAPSHFIWAQLNVMCGGYFSYFSSYRVGKPGTKKILFFGGPRLSLEAQIPV